MMPVRRLFGLLFVAAALVVAGCGTPERAKVPDTVSFARECEQRVPEGKVSVHTVPVRPRLDESHSYQELTRMAGEDGRRWVLGLTRPTLRVEARWGFTGISDRRTGRACVRPSLEMTLRYEPVLVYIGREFVADRCAYDFIRTHEQRHVDVHVRRLQEVALQLEGDLRLRLAGVTHLGPRDELESKLKAEVKDYWIPRAEAALQDVKRQHAAIDTPEEYSRSRSVCGGSIARFLPRHAQGN